MLSTETGSRLSLPAQRLGMLRFAPSIYHVGLFSILGAVLIVALAPRIDTDFWWHLKVGQYIALHHVVPAHDFMSYTLTGHAWTDHEWLAELLLYGFFRLVGLWGPIVLFSGVICATFALVYLRMSSANIHRLLALFVMAMAFMASSASWGPRIQMLTLLFLSAYMFILQRFEQTRKGRLLVLLPLIMLLWTNAHGGFVLGLAVIILHACGEFMNKVTGHPSAWSTSEIKALLMSLGGTVAVTLVNPNGFRQLLYPFTFVLPNAYTNLIEESASPNFHMPVMMLFEGMLLVLIAAAFIGRNRVNWTHLFVIAAFTHLALSQVRNVAIWAVVISPLLAYYVQACLPALREMFPKATVKRRPVTGRTGPILSVILLLLVTVTYVAEAHHFINAGTLRRAESDNYPRGAIAYMRAHKLPSHTFVSYSWGGYLLWELFPKYRDYMDSRADTLFTTSILHDYVKAYAAKPGWNTVLQVRDAHNVLIESSAPLAQVLSEDKSWRLVYRDSLSVLFSRR